jgi:translocation and assembly module TamB
VSAAERTPGSSPDDTPEDPSAEQTEVPEKRGRRRRLWLRLPFAILLQALLLLLAVLIWVLGTQSGLRFSLGLVDDLAPGLLQVEQAEGRVLGDLRLAGVQVRTPGMDLDAGEFVLRWTPVATLTGTLRVRELAVRDLDLITKPTEEPTEVLPGETPEDQVPLELPDVALPIKVELEQLLMERVSIGQPGDVPPFRVERASLSASLRETGAEIRALDVRLPEPRLEAAAEGKLEMAGAYPLNLSLTWALSQEPALALDGKAELSGDLERLVIEHLLTGSAEVALSARIDRLLEAPSWEASLEIARVDLPSIQPDLPAVDVRGRLTTSGDLDEARVQGRLSGEAPDLPDFGHLSLDLELLWSGKVLTISALELTEDKSGAHLTAEGGLDLKDEVGSFEIRAAWEKLRWPLTGELLAEARQGKLDASGTFESYVYALEAEAWGSDFPQLLLTLNGDGDQESTRIRELALDTLDGKLAATGQVSWVPVPAWDLVLKADGIDTAAQWPEIPLTLALELNSEGDLEGFGYTLEAEMDSVAFPPAKLALEGEGDIRGTRVEQLRIDTLGGEVEAQATAAWDPQLAWEATLELAGIDPGVQWPEWKGSLKGRLTSTGGVTEDGPDLTALIEGLGGTLRGYPVKADGKVAIKGADIAIEELLVASGSSKLSADGTVGEEALDLRFDVASPDLRSLLPDAVGSISAKGTVGGTVQAPAVKLELAANGVQVAGQGIERLSGKADLDLAEGGSMRLDLGGNRLLVGGVLFESLKIDGDGDLTDHQLSASVQGEPLSLDLRLTGGLGASNAYRGQLGNLSIRTSDFGIWRLQKAAELAFEGGQLTAGPLCIRDEAGSGGCAGFDQSRAGHWTANLDLDKLAFDLVSAFVPAGMILEGYLGAKADFEAEGEQLRGSATLSIPQGVVRTDTGESIELLDFSSARIGLDAGAQGLSAGLDVPLTGLGGISGDVSLPGWSLADPGRPDQPLKGRIKAGIDDLSLVSRLAPDLTDVRGRIGVDLGLSGSISAPGIAGRAELAEGGLQIPLIGLVVSDLGFKADAGRQRIDISGGFTAGDGRLELKGQGLMGSGGATLELEAKGEKLTLANSKEYFLLASPDIRVSVTPKGAAVVGELVVPEARIRPRSIPAGTVSPSSDVVLGTELEERKAFPLDLRFRVKLGDNVIIKAFGLEGRLAGDLLVFQEPGKELLGDGQLEVIDGTYRISAGAGLTAAVGKPLTVEQGIIVFAKTPVSNPGLVLTAQREGGDMTAGVRVFGTAKNPKLTFFSDSDPGMSQSEVTNYLLTGIPPKGKEGSKSDQSLSVGTYVAPKLFMEYESSLGDKQDKVKLRYEYNSWMEFQTETGDSQGADVFFKLER